MTAGAPRSLWLAKPSPLDVRARRLTPAVVRQIRADVERAAVGDPFTTRIDHEAMRQRFDGGR